MNIEIMDRIKETCIVFLMSFEKTYHNATCNKLDRMLTHKIKKCFD